MISCFFSCFTLSFVTICFLSPSFLLRQSHQLFRPDMYPPDAYERADASLHRNRLLRGPSSSLEPHNNRGSPNPRLLSPGQIDKMGRSRQSPTRESPSPSRGGRNSPSSPSSPPSSRALVVPETGRTQKTTKKALKGESGDSQALPGDVEAATAGAQVRLLSFLPETFIGKHSSPSFPCV